jgi:2-polyprenyl-3-methyl-5-hydroxy-6-metoxy-1,4-benzoquinol methylase
LDERSSLDKIALNHDYATGINGISTQYCANYFKAEILKKYKQDGNPSQFSVLELGPADGVSTRIYVDKNWTLDSVDGSRVYAENLRNQYIGNNQVNVHESLFETFEPTKTYDVIVMSHILEHVENPSQILLKAKSWMSESGIMLISVPNANSIHRELGVQLNLLISKYSLSESDLSIGHRRVFDDENFSKLASEVNLRIRKRDGFLLKMLSNAQMEGFLTNDQILQLHILGSKYVDICAELIFICDLVEL